MTIAKQDLVIAELIARKWIDVVVSTGAIICHGLVQEIGKAHFKYDSDWDDAALYAAGYNRVYDTVELEQSLDDAEELVVKILSRRTSDQPLSSSELCRLLGEALVGGGNERGILQEAHRKGIPIFIPAFSDSELGLDLAMYNNRVGSDRAIEFDPLLDLEHYTRLVSEAKYLGILTIGGGVPRNWAQQVGPYVDAMQRRGVVNRDRPVMFRYGVRICPEPVHWGGLSGCTYSEGVSWGKFISPKEGGEFAEVLCDATIALPLLVLAVLERLIGDKAP
jgi:deoxyhypusine synthase